MDRGEGLTLSLQSPFPNEHELALNACLLLSSDSMKDMKELAQFVGSRPALLTALLAHAGFYQDCGLRTMVEGTIREHFKLQLSSFWEDVAEEGTKFLLCECSPRVLEFRKGLLEGAFNQVEDVTRELSQGATLMKCCESCQVGDPDPELELISEDNEDESDPKPLSYADFADSKLSNRINFVADILRNFSFEPGAASVMAGSETMLRFLLVAARCECKALSQKAFDIISNISGFFNSELVERENKVGLSILHKMLSSLVMETVLHSKDPKKILCSLEGMANTVKSKDQIGIAFLENQILFKQIISFITVLHKDITLTFGSLDYIVIVTETGRYACDTLIHQYPDVVKTLLNYVIVDGKGVIGEPTSGRSGKGSYTKYVLRNSARLTAALAFRNLVKYSPSARRSLKRYEIDLLELVESDCSWVISQILFYLSLDDREGKNRCKISYDFSIIKCDPTCSCRPENPTPTKEVCWWDYLIQEDHNELTISDVNGPLVKNSCSG